jgi:hypothetical protein
MKVSDDGCSIGFDFETRMFLRHRLIGVVNIEASIRFIDGWAQRRAADNHGLTSSKTVLSPRFRHPNDPTQRCGVCVTHDVPPHQHLLQTNQIVA